MPEIIALFDAAGRVIGSAPRSEVYARSLWHGSAGVLLHSGDGTRVYVHRRADDKQVMAGLWDCVAGGVVDPGETPYETAVRELGEELGVHGVPLELLLTRAWESGPGPGLGGPEGLRCHLFGYTAQWDGPVHHQASEVAEGRWMSQPELAALLPGPFAPDSRILAEYYLAHR
ncbi:NUDIX domain-containing protein [Pseudonocardia pini]|uniref:NUDIX domain-containing protein n=1 Tax=Pseudonocardia pini TaxID=2758030 RepID=UPI0015F0752C|nr:NUDIX domain-containing protein [Pseudonocardia pini]